LRDHLGSVLRCRRRLGLVCLDLNRRDDIIVAVITVASRVGFRLRFVGLGVGDGFTRLLGPLLDKGGVLIEILRIVRRGEVLTDGLQVDTLLSIQKVDKDDTIDLFVILLEPITNSAKRDVSGLVTGVAVDTGGDTTEGDSLEAVLLDKIQAGLIAALELLGDLTNRADRVQNILGRKIVSYLNEKEGFSNSLTLVGNKHERKRTSGDLGLTGIGTIQGQTFSVECVAGSRVDGSIHTASTQQRAVCGVDDRINLKRGDYLNRMSMFRID
jgi:hypothetical protein